MPGRLELEKPSMKRTADFLEAVRRSRTLHRGWISPPSTTEALRTYVGRSRTDTFEPHWIVSKQDRSLVGVVNISEIVRGVFQSGYLGYYAFVPHEGCGLMAEGMQLVIRRAFRELKLHRLEANIRPENDRSIRLVKELGFRLEGYSPRYLKIGGRWRDHERWTILSDEWKPKRR